jgi:MIP family channel proteins
VTTRPDPPAPRHLPQSLLAELLGTFALVFFGCGAIANGLPPVAVALAFGLVIAVMISAVGHVSGGHFNPAVSIGFGVSRHIPWTTLAAYVAVQVAGAIAGAAVLRVTLGPAANLGVTHPAGAEPQAFVWEGILTFFLMLVITAVATDVRAKGQAAGLAIGGMVALGSLVGGPVSGASMNPARSLGPAIVAGDFGGLWIFLLAPTLGAAAAAVTYRALRPKSAPAQA